MKIPPQIALVFSLLILINCSDNISGGPGGQTTNGITATILSSVDSMAVDSAQIILRPITYLVGDELNSDTSSQINGLETYSSLDGSFEISKVMPGTYLLECIYKDSIGVIETLTINEESTFRKLDTLYANKVGSLEGCIDTSGFTDEMTITIFARGLEKSITAEDDGSFKFDGLANWTYDFVVNIEEGLNKIEKSFKTTVSSGEDKDIDTINLYAPFNPFQYLAVREFLNNMGLPAISVDSVTRHNGGQIYALWMTHMELSEIHFTINKLNFLDTINFEHNSLQKLPVEIGDLDSVKVLLLGKNNLQALPDEIAGMERLIFLELISNELEVLPISLESLSSLKDVHACFNRFTSFPPGLTTLPAIESICMDNNSIDTLPYSIGNLSTLKVLDLESNNLIGLPISIVHLTLLNKIDIDSNMVSFLPENMMDSLINIDNLELRENSIDTSNYSIEFINWLNSKSDYADWIATQK